MKNGSMSTSASLLALSVLGFGLAPSEARADDDGGWNFAVTPRFQAMFHPAHSATTGLTVMPTYGMTATMTSPDSRFAVSATGFYGKSEMTYENLNSMGPLFTDLDYEAERTDLYGYFEYTPRESNVTFLIGARYLNMDFHEEDATATFVSDYSVSGVFVEGGFRISGQIAPGSRHSFSSQVTVAAGTGEFEDTTTGQLPYSDDSFMTAADLALGYNYRMTDNAYVGLRLRAMVAWSWAEQDVATFGENDVAAFGPEINFTARF